jgi:chromosome segregation ATPase
LEKQIIDVADRVTSLEEQVTDTCVTTEKFKEVEYVTSTALNKLNKNIIDVDGRVTSLESQVTDYVTKEELADCDYVTATTLNEIEATIEDDEFVTSMALNDLDERIIDVNGRVTSLESQVTDYVTKEELESRIRELEATIATMQAALNNTLSVE